MKTAEDVIEAIDETIILLEQSAAGPCIEALIEPVDRDTYREAIRRGSELKAIKRLRNMLAEKLEPENDRPRPRKARKPRQRKANL